MRLFSPATGGFYLRELHGDAVPDDAVEISEARFRELMLGQQAGAQIVASNRGTPVLRRTCLPADERRLRFVAAVKAEAARRIEAVAPVWRQLNRLRAEGGGTDPIFAAIDAIRSASDAIEADVATLPAAGFATLDIAGDPRWPAEDPAP